MKLWAWIPTGHGPKSHYVMAESMADARRVVLIAKAEEWIYKDESIDDPECYEIVEVGPMVVLSNAND